MKQLLRIFLLLGICNVGQAQDWTATNVVSANFFPITDVTYHDGDLYAAINEVNTGRVQKSTDNGQTWNQIGLNELEGIPTHLVSINEYLYVATNDLLNGSFIYRTKDGGDTWEADTVGIPKSASGERLSLLILDLVSIDNNLLVRHGGPYYYRDITTTDAFQTFTTPTALVGSTDPVGYHNGALYAYDNGGSLDFHVSTDFGQNWTIPTATGLPNITSDLMTVNPVTGRIYLTGTYGDFGADYGIYYSDDEGENWTEMDFSSFATENSMGGSYKATAIYANGNTLYFAFENNANNSAPDVIGSTNYPTTPLAFDTTGLPDLPATVHGVQFSVDGQNMALAMNLVDVFVKGVGGPSTGIADQIAQPIGVYPNPTTQHLHIAVESPFEYTLYNLKGVQVQHGFNISGLLDVQNLNQGLYFIQIQTRDRIAMSRFIKQ